MQSAGKPTMVSGKTVATDKTVATEKTVASDKTVAKKEPAKKPAVKKTTTAKAAAKKATTKKATAKKTTTKKTATKRTTRKAPVSKQENVYVQFSGREIAAKDVLTKVKEAFVGEGHKESTIKDLKIYIKPEESAAFYVINEKYTGRVWL